MTGRALRVDAVVAGYGQHRVGPVTLHVTPGELVGLHGPSGIGKTTLAHVLAGHTAPHEGSRTVDGAVARGYGWRARPADRRKVQLVAQNPRAAVDPNRTLAAMLAIPARLAGLDPHSAVTAAADLCHLDEAVLTRRPHEVSGGQLQRAVLARALLLDPAYLIVDEATTAQDAITTAVIGQVITTQARAGMGVVWISHDRALLAAFTDRQQALAS